MTSFQAFRRDRRGNVAVTLGLAMIPIISVVAVALDYGRAAAFRSRMQAATDAAALMIAKDVPNLSAAQIEVVAKKYFLANISAEDAKNITLSTVYTPNAGNGATISMTASADFPNEFAKVLGQPSTRLSTATTATWGSARLRIALSLDVTGSMKDDGKIVALRDAVTRFINEMSSLPKNKGDVLISIVPFAKDVNVGANNDSANWITFSDWQEESGKCSYTNWQGGETDVPTYRTKTSCQNASSKYKWKAYKTKDWQGCVTDRNQDYDIVSDPPKGNASDYRAEYYDNCGEEMMGLSSDWAALKDKVKALQPSGNTNQPIGLAMAWQTLLSTSPWPAPAKETDASYLDIIIHLSDGENTQNRWTTNKATIDARQAKLCDNIKKSKITLYMIQVNTDNQPMQNVMKNCASSDDKYYMLTNGSQTVATFADISKKLSALRISK